MATVKNLLQEIGGLQQELRVWDEVKAFLERYTHPAEMGTIKMDDGRVVSTDVVINVLLDLDRVMKDIEDKIADREKMEVGSDGDGGKAPTPGGVSAKARSGSGGARKSGGKARRSDSGS
jgi:hypothetical protein